MSEVVRFLLEMVMQNSTKSHLQTAAGLLLGFFFILAGINHFRMPSTYLAMIPPFLPAPEILNSVSGVAEIMGGIGVLIPRFRKCAGWGLIALLLAVFPANIYVALYGWEGVNIARWVLWMRLPFQILFVAWVYWAAIAARYSAIK